MGLAVVPEFTLFDNVLTRTSFVLFVPFVVTKYRFTHEEHEGHDVEVMKKIRHRIHEPMLLAHQFFRNIGIGIHFLNIFTVFEHFHEPQHLLRLFSRKV